MSSLISKKTKMSDLINYRIKVITLDGRQFIGKLLSFDKHMNLVISECEEFRLTKNSQIFLKKENMKNGGKVNIAIDESKITEDKRFLGLIILRGEHVISLSVEGGITKGKVILQQNNNNSRVAPSRGTAKMLSGGSGSGTGGPIRTSGNGSGSNNTRRFNPPPGFQR